MIENIQQTFIVLDKHVFQFSNPISDVKKTYVIAHIKNTVLNA